MPRHMKSMKDVVSCDKPRLGANNLKSEDFRMGEPPLSNVKGLSPECIGWIETTEGSDTSQYLQEKKTIVILLVAASEKGKV